MMYKPALKVPHKIPSGAKKFEKDYGIGSGRKKIDFAEMRMFLHYFGGDTQTFQIYSDDDSFKLRVKPSCPTHGNEGCDCKIPDKLQDQFASYEYADLKNLEATLTEAQSYGCSICFTPNELDGKGRGGSNVTHIRAICAEIDGDLPGEDPEDPLEGWPIKPSIVVLSSEGRWHIYWLLDTDEDSISNEMFKSLQRRLIADYNSDPNVNDPSRAMRLPGSWNCKLKGGRKPQQVELYYPAKKSDEPTYYEPSEIIEAFPPLEYNYKSASSRKVTKKETDWNSPDEVAAALEYLTDSDYVGEYHFWVRVGLALYRAFLDDGYEVWRDWSANWQGFDEHTCRAKWETFHRADEPASPVTLGTVFHYAQLHGFEKQPLLQQIQPVFVREARAAGKPAEEATAEVTQPQSNIEPAKRRKASDETAYQFAKNVQKWTKKTVEKFLDKMNEEHAFVQQGNNVAFLFHAFDEEGIPIVRYLNSTSMYQRYQPIMVKIPKGEGYQTVNGFHLWQEWTGRRTYDGSGLFPGNDATVPPRYFNTWQGWGVVPDFSEDNEKKCEHLLDHIYDNVCQGDEGHYRFLMAWLARSVQNPARKPGCCVVLRSSEKGTGKSTLLNVMEKIFGNHGRIVNSMEQLIGKFNSSLGDTLFIGGDDVLWGGDKQADGQLKNLITENILELEAKGKDREKGRNKLRMMFTSNADWVVPAGKDERRYFVLDVKPVKDNAEERSKWFDKYVYKQLDNGGLEAFFGYLLQWDDFENFNWYAPPSTAALSEQKREGWTGVDKFIHDIAATGIIEGDEQTYELDTHEATPVPRTVCKEVIVKLTKSYDKPKIEQELGKALKAMGFRVNATMYVPKANGGERQVRAYEFPQLEEFRELASAYLGEVNKFNDPDLLNEKRKRGYYH